MKKILMMLAIAACAVSAQAATSYTFAIQMQAGWFNGKSMQPMEDTPAVQATMDYYRAYSLSYAGAEKVTGIDFTSSSSTYNKQNAPTLILNWMNENYNANSKAWQGAEGVQVSAEKGAHLVTVEDRNDVYIPYNNAMSSYSDIVDDNRLFVIFCIDNNGIGAYRVGRKWDVQSAEKTVIEETGVVVAKSGAALMSDWVAVPEPTSGMLMLLGLAGLCLRRKQRG